MARTAAKIFFLASAAALILLEGSAWADMITGSAELYQQAGSDTSTDSTGLRSDGRANTFLQRYNVNFYNMIYPYLNLRAGMRVEKQNTDARLDGVENDSEFTLLLPSVGLTLRNPFLSAGVSYDKREEKQESDGATTRNYRETTSGFLGFLPVGLPSLDLQVVEQKMYDRDHVTQDRDLDTLSVTSVYRPINTVDLSYRVLYSEDRNHLNDTETDGVTQTGRASYGDTFYKGQATLSASYNFMRNDIDRKLSGSATDGGITSHLQLFPIAGLSGVTDAAAVGALTPNTGLIDGNLTATSGLNVGSSPSLAGDVRQRNGGLDFGIITEVNSLFVWVDRALPDSVARSFAWEIYTSTDNQNWTLLQAVFPAPFGAFDNRFEISFASVKTRYIKAVTRPLSVAVVVPPGIDVSNIFITEVQAFVDRTLVPTSQKTLSDMTRSEFADVSGRLYFVRSPSSALYYDLYYQDRTSDQSGQNFRSDTLINSLVGSARFNPLFTGLAKILRENDDNVDGSITRYADYEGTLLAEVRSLPKLRHTLTTTTKRETWSVNDAAKDSLTFYLTNDAEVYPGITAVLAGGATLASGTTNTTVVRSSNSLITAAATVAPHRTLLFNATYNWTAAELQTSGSFDAKTTTRVTDLNASYNPVSTLYIFGSIIQYQQTGLPSRTVRTLSGSWSFQQNRGALEVRFIYSEDYVSDTQTRSRVVGPYARWKMNPRMYLETAYTIVTTDSPFLYTENKTITTGFKVYF